VSTRPPRLAVFCCLENSDSRIPEGCLKGAVPLPGMRAVRGILTVSLAFALGFSPPAGVAQQAAKIPRVGLLRPGSPPDPYVEAFRRGLRDLGYVEEQTIALEYRWA
jgi:hypothetical protein